MGKYESDACNDAMTFQDCELAILRQAVDRNEEKKKKLSNSKEVQKMIAIVETFLRKKKCLCYGGTAINNILPEQAQFYNREIEIPDYDFFSPVALEHAKELADVYHKAGYDVEAKAGVHPGTFKVFVNFIPMADITELHPDLFATISQDAIVIDRIFYCPANFLRMNMFLELSRPEGDISRWEKVLKRLNLLNKYHPLTADRCNTVDFQRSMETNSRSEIIYKTTRDVFIEQEVVFFGGFASSLYAQFMTSEQKRLTQSIPDFDVLSDDVELCCTLVKQRLKESGIKFVSVVNHPSLGEIIPEHREIKVGKDTIACVYRPIACHNYNIVKMFGKSIRIATIDTMLSFYLAFLYGTEGYHSQFKERLLCMSKFLFDVEEKNRLSQKKLLKRFSINCFGKQDTLETLRAEKAEKFEALKDQRDSYEYQRLFLKYTPSHPTTREPEIRTMKKKTRPNQTKRFRFELPKRKNALI